jgi:hypothetical protein
MPEILVAALILALIYQLKHFLSDYVFQTSYMMKKGNADWSFFMPLLSHTLVHGVTTFVIALIYLRDLKWALLLMLGDTLIHFFMDRIKASPRYLGRYHLYTAGELKDASPARVRENHLYWVAFGFDQMIHHVTHLALVAALISLKFNLS